ncbi:Rho GTPase-activating protein 100F [Strongyloides ratti]|uniref:Rho GTPase-activating protein 100F n=1 Tax=Strongyloides ratti TaxID=34506 RepID=A0A090KVX0_STRRB|nr:Rho GTPase-activating protein 100F [Strongyloides ratti]CEF59407.1 Rho GTPase-activating protein 100F [Strongyloides ratti]
MQWSGNPKKPYGGFQSKADPYKVSERYSGIPEEVFQQIRQVDQQTSTLTSQGIIGFSARILDKSEYRLKQGSNEIIIVQLVEIIKKPGQTLGLYLREGNGMDRSTGVFASRFGENSELEKYGDIIRSGDEILSVNNVDVSQMSIDDVVLILSIPRRLLLRIRYLKNRRQEISNKEHREQPVVVFQKLEDQKDSGLASQTLLNKPTSTASTWLGKQARQVKRQVEQHNTQKVDINQPLLSSQNVNQQNFRTLERNDNHLLGNNEKQEIRLPYPSSSLTNNEIKTVSPNVTFYPFNEKPSDYQQNLTSKMKTSLIDPMASVVESARVLPPKLTKQNTIGKNFFQDSNNLSDVKGILNSNVTNSGVVNQPSLSNLETMTLGRKDIIGNRMIPNTNNCLKNYSQNIEDTSRNIITSGTSSSINPLASSSIGISKGNISNVMGNYGENDLKGINYKSNSLPRRRFQLSLEKGDYQPSINDNFDNGNITMRNVKWRNDVVGGLSFESKLPQFEDRRAKSIDICKSDNTTFGYDMRNKMQNFSYLTPESDKMYGLSINKKLGSSFTSGKTINDIFSAKEYRNWAGGSLIDGPTYKSNIYNQDIQYMNKNIGYNLSGYSKVGSHNSRWSIDDDRRLGSVFRSNSLPAKSFLLNLNGDNLSSQLNFCNRNVSSKQPYISSQVNIFDNNTINRQINGTNILDRLHISPIMNRRVPLKPAGPGIDIDCSPTQKSLNGMLQIYIIEGRNLKVPDQLQTKQMYVVLEINNIHRARTGISTYEQNYRWKEGFEIDIYNAHTVNFFVYSWHPQMRHKLCYKGNIKLVDALLNGQLNGERLIQLNLEPSNQLMIKINYININNVFRRIPSLNNNSSFGVSLKQLVTKHNSKTPIILGRLIQEIETRGVSTPGLYILCGSIDKKRILRHEMERCLANQVYCDIGIGNVADVNVLTCLIKDFLRELPEPLVSSNVYQMLMEAETVILPSDNEGNQHLVLKIIDCLPMAHKNTLILVLDHIKNVISSSYQINVTQNHIIEIFGPLIFCTSTPTSLGTIDIPQAYSAFKLLLDIWPGVSTLKYLNTTNSYTPYSVMPTSDPVSESQC